MEAVLEAGGDVLIRGDHWFEALLPSTIAMDGNAFQNLTGDDRGEILEENVDHQLDVFREKADAGDYHTVAEVMDEIQGMVAAHPDILAYESIGTTHEGRAIPAVRVGPPGEGRPTFFVVAMHHAREWISVEVPMGLLNHLVNGYASDPAIKDLVDSREIWVIPVLNPDGLEYSQSNYRMWRKNRRDNGNGVYGVDLNRNWGYKWGHGGSSSSPRSDTYMGPEPFSEPELQALKALALREQPTASVSFHSYGKLVLWPWSWQYDAAPQDTILAHHAKEMAKLNGYSPKQSSDLYPSSGDFDDWFYGELGAISYTIELANRFVPDESQIPEIVSKNVQALLYYLKNCAAPFAGLAARSSGGIASSPSERQLVLARQRLDRVRKLRQTELGADGLRALERLEGEVVELVQVMGQKGQLKAYLELVKGASAATRKQLGRAYRQASMAR
jgi:carboxypeptidase T